MKSIRRTGLLALALTFAGCLGDDERTVINAWLNCEDECEAVNDSIPDLRDSVAAIGFEAVPRLAGALYGPPPHREENMRRRFTRSHARLGATLAGSRAAFVQGKIDGYTAQYQKHASLSLGDIGRRSSLGCFLFRCQSGAAKELRKAVQRDSVARATTGAGFYRSDVLSSILRELEKLGDTTTLAPVGMRIRPRPISADTGTTIQFQAVFIDAAGRSLPNPGGAVAWVSDNGSVATIDQTGLAKALEPGAVLISASDPAATGWSDSHQILVVAP